MFVQLILNDLLVNTFISWSNENHNILLLKVEGEGEVAQSCPTLCDPMDCSLPGSSILGILRERILEWVAI